MSSNQESVRRRLSSYTESAVNASTAFCIIDEFGGGDDVEVDANENPDEWVITECNRVLWAPADATYPKDIPLPEYAPPEQVAFASGRVNGGSGRRVYLFEKATCDDCEGSDEQLQYPLDAELYEQIAETLGVGVDTLARNTQINTTPETGDDNARYIDSNPPVIDLKSIEGHTGYIAIAELLMDTIRPLSN